MLTKNLKKTVDIIAQTIKQKTFKIEKTNQHLQSIQAHHDPERGKENC